MTTLDSLRQESVRLAGLCLLLAELSARGATLADFGYDRFDPPSSRFLLVLLANFTNHADHPFRFGTDYGAATNYYDNWVFNPTNQPDSLNGYFNEISNGRFTWRRGGTIMVLLSTNQSWASYEARTGDGGLANLLYSSNLVHQAMITNQSNSFSFTDYDADHDTNVTATELTILSISNDDTFGGGVRGAGTVQPPGYPVSFSGSVALTPFDWGLGTFAHELIHRLEAPRSLDLYGESCLGKYLNVMSCSMAASEICHVDPWHKLQFAWSEPVIASLRTGGVFTLPAAQLGRSNAPLILYDASPANTRGVKEFFLLEYRTPTVSTIGGGYDKSVPAAGLVIWHVAHQADNSPVGFVDAALPKAERGWGLCTNCHGLWLFATGGRCPATGSAHLTEEKFKDFVLVKDDPFSPGEHGWCCCSRCQQLFSFAWQVQSVCPAGGTHDSTGSGAYCVPRLGDPEAIGGGSRWHRCTHCQVLFRDPPANTVCPAATNHCAGTESYLVTTTGAWAMTTEGAPNFELGGSTPWGSGVNLPRLHWYDGTEMPVGIAVHPFSTGAESITIEILSQYDTWVDFNYTGTENGTFGQPWNTFAEGVAATGHGGTMRIKTGRSAETARVTKHLFIQAYNGPATIGR